MTQYNILGEPIEEEGFEDCQIRPKYDLFKDIIGSISDKRANLFLEDEEEATKAYVPYIVNGNFSQVDKFGRNDSALFAYEINCRPNTPHRLQYDFYYYGLPKARRYLPWAKAENINNLDIVMAYYDYTPKKARQALKVLTEAQIEVIKSRMSKGEIKTKKAKSKA